MNPTKPDSRALAAITRQVHGEWRHDFGKDDEALAQAVALTYADIENDPAWRFDILKNHAPEARRLLDIASGYGTAVFHGLARGFEIFGVEPSAAKHAIARDLLGEAGKPLAWRGRNLRAVGEALPFRDGSFDAVLSYQTLEHVSQPKSVLSEWLRITRSGGGIHLRCPDYSGTYEGHYLLPWLPLMPRPWVRLYLRLLGRPDRGIEGITYVTQAGVRRMLRELTGENPGLEIAVTDLEKERALRALAARGLGRVPGLFPIYRLYRFSRTVFRSEKPLHLWIGVRRKPDGLARHHQIHPSPSLGFIQPVQK